MTAKPVRRWANCTPPYGTPNHGRLRYSLDSNQGVCSDASSTEMQCLKTTVPLSSPTYMYISKHFPVSLHLLFTKHVTIKMLWTS
jgi:hypothetical protein